MKAKHFWKAGTSTLILALVCGCLSGCPFGDNQAAKDQAAKDQADANAKAAMTYVDPMKGYKPKQFRPGVDPASTGTAKQ